MARGIQTQGGEILKPVLRICSKICLLTFIWITLTKRGMSTQAHILLQHTGIITNLSLPYTRPEQTDGCQSIPTQPMARFAFLSPPCSRRTFSYMFRHGTEVFHEK